MGERGQIKIGKIYLYTHWRGDELKEILRNALSRKQRCIEYLTRNIFEEMIKEDLGIEIGYGIGTTKHNDLNYPLLEVRDNEVVEYGKKNKILNI